VPACGNWRLRDLAHHLGEVHRWAAAAALGDGTAPPEDVPPLPPDHALADWLREGLDALTVALADPGRPCWTFAGPATAPGGGAVRRSRLPSTGSTPSARSAQRAWSTRRRGRHLRRTSWQRPRSARRVEPHPYMWRPTAVHAPTSSDRLGGSPGRCLRDDSG
jgi:hypothetical protein